jgi:signal transduction histidine kinase
VGSGGVTTALLRESEPLGESSRRLRSGLARLTFGAVLAAAAAALAGWLLTRRLTRPLGALRASALALGDGDFTVDPPATGLAELDDVGAALRSSARRIGTLVERERAFSAQASHQLRTPVAGLRVALETEMAHPRPDREAILRESLVAAERLEATIDGLLRLARGQPDDRHVLDVPAHLAQLELRWRPSLRAAGRRLVTGCTGPLPPVRASATAIDHVLDVLVDNALHHGAGTITVQAGGTGAGVVITVTDEGEGVAEPAEVFQRRARPGGRGIGLALGRTLAAAEGAELRMRSARPAVFELTLATRPEPTA